MLCIGAMVEPSTAKHPRLWVPQVTIVAVLQKLGANEDLFALVFGESCLNDAVSQLNILRRLLLKLRSTRSIKAVANCE